jgi:GNAT superfamily N-acetyltransferase
MSNIEIVPATAAHATRMAPNLRAEDAAEAVALGLDATEALIASIAHAEWAETYLVDGEPAAIVGLGTQSLLFGPGRPWMLTTPLVEQHRRRFLQESRRQLARMRATYATLENYVHADAHRAIRWLEWLGFIVEPPAPYGARGRPFRHFHMGMPLIVGASSVAEITGAPGFADVAREYEAECKIAGLPAPVSRFDTYMKLEQTGTLFAFSATVAGRLVGFLSLLCPEIPHYGRQLGVTESFFVARAHRKTGFAGLKLLRLAEKKAHEIGSPGLLVSAPSGGPLAAFLPRAGYAETNRVFFKKVGDE